MGPLEWEEIFETGNQLLDSQHKLFIQQINACIEASRNGALRGDLIQSLECILCTLEEHFQDEEIIFLEHGLLTKAHLAQHAYALQNLQHQIATIKVENCKWLSIQGVVIPLYDWCVAHHMDEDSRLMSDEIIGLPSHNESRKNWRGHGFQASKGA